MWYEQRNRRKMEKLDPVVKGKVEELVEKLEEIGEDILIYNGRRTAEEQDRLFKLGPDVTKVNDSNSWHVWGMAIDVVPVGKEGEARWKDGRRYRRIADEAKKLGFEWGWDLWKWDKCHFQYTGGLTIRDMKGGARLKYGRNELPVGLESTEASSRHRGARLKIASLRRAVNRSSGVVRDRLAKVLERLLNRIRK